MSACDKFMRPSIDRAINGLWYLWPGWASSSMDIQSVEYEAIGLGDGSIMTNAYISSPQLFASNMAFPMLSYVYWRDDPSSMKLTNINIATLAGTMLGQVLFGYLADKYGRKKMYGLELMLLITSTLGVVMSSNGVNHSMSVYAWLIWWRIVVGIGVGADYPLSAVITSE